MSAANSIAIDGPVASGKTTVGKLVAERLGCLFLDTGLMYRAVTLAALSEAIALDDAKALSSLANSMEVRLLDDESGERLLVSGRDVTDDLRGPEVERGVSAVSSVSGVRRTMVEKQREIASQRPVVMVGRDIGTVVLPDADAKVYLAASVAVRADRRHRELKSSGSPIRHSQVVEDLVRRDSIDSERADSPLRPAEDAVIIDTDKLGVEDVVQKVVSIICR